ncbi:TetR/AcrR family transcriptional regulator [Micromonospora sp. LZ34]
MSAVEPSPSPRRLELTELAYRYVLEHGLAEMSLRPLATAIGSSPRVLMFLFGNKEGLVRALLARARADELAMLAQLRDATPGEPVGLAEAGRRLWAWLSSPRHRRLLTLWAEAYARSLADPDGPWAGFARQTVEDWLDVLAKADGPATRRGHATGDERTLLLAVLRGALLDLLATGDTVRTTAAVEQHLRHLPSGP